MGNFIKRMLVNVVGVPLILGAIYLGGKAFVGVVLIISFFSMYEFYGLAKEKGFNPFSISGIIAGLLWIIAVYVFTGSYELVYAFVLVFVVVITLMQQGVSGAIANVSTTLFGFVYIPFFLSFLVRMRIEFSDYAFGYDLVLVLFVSVWVCDSLAYLVGKMIGKHKLSPLISPGKTVEGSVAGFLGSVAVFLIFYYSGGLTGVLDLQKTIVLGGIVGVFAQLGDLLESMFKRDAGVKDSGKLLPGHGGFLDRFDAFFVVSPVYYIFVKILILVG